MKLARSLTHGGTESTSVQSRPPTSSSASGSLLSLTFLSTVQAWFVLGEAQTRPVQSVSCHATRTDTCDMGSSMAPLDNAAIAYWYRFASGGVQRSCDDQGAGLRS